MTINKRGYQILFNFKLDFYGSGKAYIGKPTNNKFQPKNQIEDITTMYLKLNMY